MAKKFVQYTGTADVRVLEKRDFDSLGISEGKKTTWDASNRRTVPAEELPAAFVDRLKEFNLDDEFKVVEG